MWGSQLEDLSRVTFDFYIRWGMMCQQNKFLFDFKSILESWYDKMYTFFLSVGFKHCEFDKYLCVEYKS